MLFIIGLLKVVLVIVCLLLVLLVMMQRPKQEGLGAAFAQGMMNEIGGAHTANILQKGTTYLGVMFFGISFLLSVLISYEARADRRLGEEAAASVGDKTAGTGGDPTQPLDFNPPDLGKIPGVDTPLGGIELEGGTTPPEGGTTPGGEATPEPPKPVGPTEPSGPVDPEKPAGPVEPPSGGTPAPHPPPAPGAPSVPTGAELETPGENGTSIPPKPE